MSAGGPSSISSCALLPRLGECGDSGALLERLIKAALADEDGQALDKAIADLMPAGNGVADAAGPLSRRQRGGARG